MPDKDGQHRVGKVLCMAMEKMVKWQDMFIDLAGLHLPNIPHELLWDIVLIEIENTIDSE